MRTNEHSSFPMLLILILHTLHLYTSFRKRMRNEGAKVVGITLRKDFGGKRNFMTHIVCIVVKWTQHNTWFLYSFTHIAESYMKYENEEIRRSCCNQKISYICTMVIWWFTLEDEYCYKIVHNLNFEDVVIFYSIKFMEYTKSKYIL